MSRSLAWWSGDLHLQDRACALSTDPHTECLGGDRPHQARASGMDAGANGLFDSGPQGVCHVPGHGLGGDGLTEVRSPNWNFLNYLRHPVHCSLEIGPASAPPHERFARCR